MADIVGSVWNCIDILTLCTDECTYNVLYEYEICGILSYGEINLASRNMMNTNLILSTSVYQEDK